MKNLLLPLLLVITLLSACNNAKKPESQSPATDSTSKKAKILAIQDYFQVLKKDSTYFPANKEITIDTLDKTNGFMQVSYADKVKKTMVKVNLKVWKKSKQGKHLLGLLFRNCADFCQFKAPVFLEFDKDHYQNVSKAHYPATLQDHLNKKLKAYTQTCQEASTFIAALLPQVGQDIQTVIYSDNNQTCPQTLIGVLKYNGQGFDFIEPVGNTNTQEN